MVVRRRGGAGAPLGEEKPLQHQREGEADLVVKREESEPPTLLRTHRHARWKNETVSG
jgi:hypothetical protein